MADSNDPFGFKKMYGGSANKGKKGDLFGMMGLENPFGKLFPSKNMEEQVDTGYVEEETPRIVDMAAKKRARSADLVIPPEGYTNCGNCEYFTGNYCNHAKVDQPVEANWCCVYWNSEGTVRVADL